MEREYFSVDVHSIHLDDPALQANVQTFLGAFGDIQCGRPVVQKARSDIDKKCKDQTGL